ncbi:hypothetical protein FH972_025546 [Carpinus fangiana]|uniref:Uncharacterized protein n=1 Tax=Carpinus fangiana TaxID=176857 RepID=A0A5N6L3X9_9ROSI|nr:hypothetical protein FH972_025546 [Carpinus fangiana]
MAPSAIETTSGVESPLQMRAETLSARELNMKDAHVVASLGLFVIHNVIRRNLASCSSGALTVSSTSSSAGLDKDPFLTYASYTIFTVTDHFDALDTIWFPAFTGYDKRFQSQIDQHDSVVRPELVALQTAVERARAAPATDKQAWQAVSDHFARLLALIEPIFDLEEQLSNGLGHRVPISEIRSLEKQQESRRQDAVKVYGNLWSACFLLRSMTKGEKEVFPPGLPRVVANGMMTAGAVKYGRELKSSEHTRCLLDWNGFNTFRSPLVGQNLASAIIVWQPHHVFQCLSDWFCFWKVKGRASQTWHPIALSQ